VTHNIYFFFWQDLEEFRAYFEHYKKSKQFNHLQRRQSESTGDNFVETANMTNNCNGILMEDTLPMSLGLSISQLWKDEGIQQVYGLAHQFQLNETAG
jgi:hypothetical protein